MFVLSGGHERVDRQRIITVCGNVRHGLCPGEVGVWEGPGASQYVCRKFSTAVHRGTTGLYG